MMAPRKGSTSVKKKQPALPKAKSTRKPATTTKKKSHKQAVNDPTSDNNNNSVEDSGGEVEVIDETAADAADADVE
jgi:hypothetical protein